MSFILDALKKSEAERQKQTGPTLLELRITQPRRRYPLWALCVGALLAINVLVLLVLLLHRPGPAAAAASSSTSATPVGTTAVPTSVAPSANRGPATAAAARAAVSSLAAGAAAAASAGAGAAPNPADYEPAVPASAVGAGATTAGNPGNAAPGGNSTLRGGDYTSLPSLSELGGNAPNLQLDLLAYSDRPSDRYALVNMHRVHEGDVLPDGTRVLAITHSGVAMEYRGQQFMLKPGGTVPAGNN